MSSGSLERRLRKLEAVLSSDDPRRWLVRSSEEWPDAALERVAAMTEAEWAEMLKESAGRW